MLTNRAYLFHSDPFHMLRSNWWWRCWTACKRNDSREPKTTCSVDLVTWPGCCCCCCCATKRFLLHTKFGRVQVSRPLTMEHTCVLNWDWYQRRIFSLGVFISVSLRRCVGWLVGCCVYLFGPERSGKDAVVPRNGKSWCRADCWMIIILGTSQATFWFSLFCSRMALKSLD